MMQQELQSMLQDALLSPFPPDLRLAVAAMAFVKSYLAASAKLHNRLAD